MESGKTQVVTKVVWDMETMQVTYRETVPYYGEWALCKGGNSKAEMRRANQLSEQQQAQQRMEFDLRNKQLSMVNPQIEKLLANGGMTPETEAALRSIAMNTLPETYNDLYGDLSQQLTRRGISGGEFAGSGDVARQYGALGSRLAGDQAKLLSQIPLQKEVGLYNAMNTALGVGGMYQQAGQGFNQGALGALGVGQQAAGQADAATSGFWGSLVGAGLGLVKPR